MIWNEHPRASRKLHNCDLKVSLSRPENMLPSYDLELRILCYARIGERDGWRPMTLPELGNVVECQNWNEVLDALRRLHEQKIVCIRRWTELNGFVLYDTASSTEFFSRGSFQVQITPRGHTYEEALEELCGGPESYRIRQSSLSGVPYKPDSGL